MESGDYDPGPWKGYSFATARKAYKSSVIDRSYDDAVDKDVKRDDLVPESIETDSEAPVVVVCDVTGSMGEWPGVIFSKLPYLDIEGREYLGDTMQISFAAVGDGYSDRFPLQVSKFSAGKEMEAALKKLVIEGGGGGSSQESYDLAALYYARNCKMPKANKPIMIFIGDEGLYDFADKATAEHWSRSALAQRMSMEEIFAELKRKFAVYLVRKPYEAVSANSLSPTDKRIQGQWEALLGEDHVSLLPSADRVVDVIFGIFAKETNRIGYFKKELEHRQLPDAGGDKKVEMVMKSLNTIHALPSPNTKGGKGKGKGGKSAGKSKKLPTGFSVTRKKPTGDEKDSISLI